jgi:hypothetical protein
VAEPAPRRPFAYAYAPLRVVPRVERGECANVGVVLFCRSARFLGALTGIDEARLRALWPLLDVDGVRRHLEALRLVAAGDPAGGAVARLPQHERFGWLTAPASTVVQPGPVHGGVCADPAAELAALFERLVAVPANDGIGAP